MSRAAGLFLLLLLVVPAVADEEKPTPKPNPLTDEQAAEAVLAAVQAKDAAALKALAETNEPDPWVVADLLCYRGEHDAAEAFAKAAPRVDTKRLPAYVASQRGKPPNTATRRVQAEVLAAIRAGRVERAVAMMRAVERTAADMTLASFLYSRGLILRALRRLEESAVALREAAELAEELGWLRGAAGAMQQCGISAIERSDLRGALDARKRHLEIEEARQDRRGIARALGSIGITYQGLGNHEEALGYSERALSLLEELGDGRGIAITLGHLGLIHQGLGSYTAALEYQERAWKQAVATGHKRQAASSVSNIANLYKRLDSYDKALEYQERALKMMTDLGDRLGMAKTLGNIGIIHHGLGGHAKALGYLERALKHMEELKSRVDVAVTLASLGAIHRSLGDHDKALEYMQGALKLAKAIGTKQYEAYYLGAIGAIHHARGDHTKALALQERALQMREDLGDRAGVAAAHAAIGMTYQARASYPEALKRYERSLALAEALGDKRLMATALVNIGTVHTCLGAYARAHEYHKRTRRLAAELGALDIEIQSLGNLAYTQLSLGEPAQAVQSVRDAIKKLPMLLSGLSEEHGASVRGRWADLLETGVRAGMQLEDAAQVCFFIESGRAGALLESLGGRKALAGTVIPAAVLAQETVARSAVLAAQARLGRASTRGRLKQVREARAALDAAHGRVLDTVARIQRASKAAADVVYPAAAALEDIQAALDPDEALVSYATLAEGAVALVVTRTGARTVRLGTVEMTLRLDDTESPWEGPVERLRKAVMEPLGLGKAIRRLLISPAGSLSYVPFAILAPDHEVVCVSSGTTYCVLRDERAERGERVLAVGDPNYATTPASGTSSVYRSAGNARLLPLPATRKEAKAAGDVLLLGDRATETSVFRVLHQQERWRAVHFACHGLVNPGQPQLSSLALTADDESDGFLTVHEVFRSKIRADLVVLSACETARGKVYRGEGVVGFTRAFMVAGTPRVICSLWKVDDEATQALMIKFYELWNPKDGTGLGAAAALKEAQAFIRGHDKWKHPYYWAAWVLWGLPN